MHIINWASLYTLYIFCFPMEICVLFIECQYIYIIYTKMCTDLSYVIYEKWCMVILYLYCIITICVVLLNFPLYLVRLNLTQNLLECVPHITFVNVYFFSNVANCTLPLTHLYTHQKLLGITMFCYCSQVIFLYISRNW